MAKTVIISEQGAKISVKNQQLSIQKGGEEIKKIKDYEIEQILIMGKVDLTSSAISKILARGIDCVFLTSNGRYKGRLLGRQSKNIPLRIKQFESLSDPEKSLSIAKAIVAGKIHNQRYLLLRFQRELRDSHLANVLAKMRLIREKVKIMTKFEEVLGCEGEASHLYFSNLGRCIKNHEFYFTGRNRRPPKDPVNACLSFGYSLLLTIIEGFVLEVGLDPYLGALHKPEYGRPSLVLDLMEEFRPLIVDRLVLRIINRRQLSPQEFGPPEPEFDPDSEDIALIKETSGEGEEIPASSSAVYIRGGNKKIFLSSFYSKLRERIYYPPTTSTLSWRQVILQQVYKLAKVIKGNSDSYQPFIMRQ